MTRSGDVGEDFIGGLRPHERLRHLLEAARRNRWLLSVAVTAMVLRVGWVVLTIDRQPRFDEISYIGHAERLVRGEGFVDPRGQPASYWPVGYPAALAVAYFVVGREGHLAGSLLNTLCGTATAVLVFLLATSLFGATSGRLAGMLAAIYPNHVFFASLRLAEPLFTLLVVATAFLLLRAPSTPRDAAVGLLLGLGALTRPGIALFPLVLPCWYRRQGCGLRAATKRFIVVGLTMLAVVTPWIARNHGVSGRWEIAASGGDAFWVGNNPHALGGSVVRAPKFHESAWDGDEFDASRAYRLGLATIAAEPGHALLRFLAKITYFFALETDGLGWNMKGFEKPWPTWLTLSALALANVSYVAVLGGCVLAFVNGPRGPLRSLLSLLATYMLTIAIVFVGDPRYHYPLVPLAAILSSQAFAEELPRLRSGERWARLSAVKWAAAMCVFALLVLINLFLKSVELRAWPR